MPAFDPRNIVEGPVRTLVGASALDPTPSVLPADSTPFGAAWPGWRELGFTTEDGVTFGGLTADRTPVMTGQQRAAVAHLSGNVAETVAFTMLEATLENIRQAAGRGVITSVAPSAPGSTTPTFGHDQLEFTDSPVRYVALGVEGFGPNGQPRRMILPIVTLAINGDLNYRLGQPMGVPVTAGRAGGPAGNPKWRQIIPPG